MVVPIGAGGGMVWRRVRTTGVVLAAALALHGCGGTDVTPPEQTDDGVAQDAPVGDDAPVAGDDGASDEDDAGPAAAAAIEVDAAALPGEPAGFATLAADLCTLWTVEELDAFFGGAGGLAVSEPLPDGCRWAVEGLPRTHYVDATTSDEDKVDAVMEGERTTVDGVAVHLQRGPEDAWATVATPDGRHLVLRVHGDFDVEQRALDGGLDPAASALAENVVGRL